MLRKRWFLHSIVLALLVEMLALVLLTSLPASVALADEPPTAVPTLPPLSPSTPLRGAVPGAQDVSGVDLRSMGIKPAAANLSSNLDELARVWLQDHAQAYEVGQTYGLEITGNRVAVTVITVNAQIAEAIKASARGLGGEITAEYDRWFDAQLPITALVDVASLPGVSLVQPLARVYLLDDSVPTGDVQNDAYEPLAGSHLTQGVAASNANAWHTAGINGAGVWVAILDSFTNIAGLQSSGELPSGPCLTILGTLQSSSHGSAVAEIVHDMAPGACLILVSPTSATQMASRIQELANYPIATRPKIITSSMGFYNDESGDGTGAVSNAIAYALSQGVLFTQAAGNQARYNWQAAYSDADADNYLNFSGTDEIMNVGYVPSGYYIHIFMRWNAWPTTNQDYDLGLVRFNTGTGIWDIVATSVGAQTGSQPPIEAISYPTSQSADYGIIVNKYSATGNHVIDIMGHNSPTYEYTMAGRSLVDPATSSSVFAVAALNVVSPYNLETYSSQGPALGSGGSLAAGNAQPRIAGYANVDTASYPSSSFNGTSSATPHVAGAAALVFDAYPSYTVAQVKSFLESRAVDMGSAGYDYAYGAGRLYLGTPPTSTPGAHDGIGIYARATGDWYLRNAVSPGSPDYTATYGGSWATPVVGDWSGDGTDNIGVYDSSNGNWYLRNTNSGGAPSITVNGYGGWWGLPVTGDWDGNGTDTIGLFVPSTGEWLLRNSNSYGSPDIYFTYGGSWGYPVVGDWNGDGVDTIGVYNPNDGNWYLRNSNSGGGANIVVNGYGGWWGFPIVGDWDGNNTDTISIFAYQTGEWLLRNSNSYGSPDIYFAYGGSWGTPLAGDWNGPAAMSADFTPFNQDWNAVNQTLSAIGTDYSLEDLLRFALDPSVPLGTTPGDEPVSPPVSPELPAVPPVGEPQPVKPNPPTLPQG
ncbi:MAG: S8 family serine peptidase [Anaerolineae bacterium]|nr:S8 family serine peptidase [Anaerolineae bacterium]